MSPLTKDYTTGDVLCVLYFPHVENKEEGEPRFLICLEDLEDKAYVVPMTKKLKQQKCYPKSFVINESSPEGRSMKIPYDSLIIPERAAIIRKPEAFKHGKCSDDLLDQLNILCK